MRAGCGAREGSVGGEAVGNAVLVASFPAQFVSRKIQGGGATRGMGVMGGGRAARVGWMGGRIVVEGVCHDQLFDFAVVAHVYRDN